MKVYAFDVDDTLELSSRISSAVRKL